MKPSPANMASGNDLPFPRRFDYSQEEVLV